VVLFLQSARLMMTVTTSVLGCLGAAVSVSMAFVNQNHHQEDGVNGHHGVIVTRFLGRCLEQESVTKQHLEMERHHVLGLQFSQRIVLQIVTIAATGMTRCVELMGRIIKMIAGLHVRGFLWVVPTNVLVMINTALLTMTVTSLASPVRGGPRAPVPVGMVFVYGMVTGVNGPHGVIVIRILRRNIEQESVTTQHLAMEVHHVLGLQFRKNHVVLFLQSARLMMTVTTSVLGCLGAAVSVSMAFVNQNHHQEDGVNGHHGVIVTRFLGRCLEQESVTKQHLEMERHHVLGLQFSQRIVLQIVTIAATGMTRCVELMGRIIKMIAGLHVRGFLWVVPTNVLVMINTALLTMTVTSLASPVRGGPRAPVPVGMVFVYGMVIGVNGHRGVIVTRVLTGKLEQESVTTQHLAMEVHHALGVQFRKDHVVIQSARLMMTVTILVRSVMRCLGAAVPVTMAFV